MDNQRIKNGFDYFWKMKPSELKAGTFIHLHVWMSMLKPLVEELEITEADKPNPDRPLTPEEQAEELNTLF